MAAATMARRVEPEWLDALPARDARAVRARRDLRRVNALMGNVRILAGALGELPPGAHLAEVGAGSGEVMLALARSRVRRGARFRVTLVDREPCVDAATTAELAALGFETRIVRADVFDWLTGADLPVFDAIAANLFLHHFEAPALARMLALAASHTRLFVGCEPRRSRFALAAASLLGIAGCNDVTRHDAVVSVRAGFRDGEVASLWPADGWRVDERACGLFSHRFIARRESGR